MQLRLMYPPTPEAAPMHAELCVSAAREVDGIELDYSVESLVKLDGIIENLRREGVASEQVAETLFTFGCYVGEVFVRQAGGRWCLAEGTPMAGATGFPLIIQLGANGYCNPIGKVFKRLEQGEEHNLSYFYQVFTREDASEKKGGTPGRR
jgi:hypothetical protein